MYRTSVYALSLGLVAQSVLGQTVETYENSGIVTTPPQIDARNFLNKGQFFATNGFISSYYYPYNTLNYTNQGEMRANVGFEFKTVPTDGTQKRPAVNFHNANGATVSVGGNLEIAATNVVNRGSLFSGSTGRITLNAQKADLSRSSIAGGSFGNTFSGFLFNDFESDAFNDYWGINLGQIGQPSFNDFFASSSTHEVEQVGPGGYEQAFVNVFAFSADVEKYSRQTVAEIGDDGETTNYVQVVYVMHPSDPNFNSRVSHELTFFKQDGEDDFEGKFAPVAIDWFTTIPHPETGADTEVVLSFSDDFANRPAAATLIQRDFEPTLPPSSPTTPRPTFRPSNFLIARQSQVAGDVEVPGDLPISPIPVFPPVSYSAYAGSSIANSLRHDTNILGSASYTNLPGRVEITAGDLNLNFTQLQAENYLKINATNHFSGSFRSLVMAPMSDISLVSTNSQLVIGGLMPDELPLLVGQIRAYSAFWSRDYEVDDVAMEDNYAVLIIDASDLRIATPDIKDLNLRAENLVVDDALNVSSKLNLDTTSLTISNSGHLNLTSELLVWGDSLPRLTSLTNLGAISAVNEVKFMQNSQPTSPDGIPYQWFVNHGTIQVGGITVAADNFIQSGFITTSFGDADLRFGEGVITNATISLVGAGGSVELSGNNLLVSNSLMFADDKVSVAVNGVLNDGGVLGNNMWFSRSGIDLPVKPAVGDLLGTTLWVSADEFSEAEITWAGEDRGLSESGFQNNAAVQHLWLQGGFGSLFTFHAAGGQNAIYVENLALSDDVELEYLYSFAVDPNFTVYFRNLWTLVDNGDGTVDLEVSGLKASELEAATGGRIRAMAPARSTVSLRNAQGQVIGSIDVDAALRASGSIDSDADGIMNNVDDYPFDGPVLRSAVAEDGKVTLTWNAAANTKYTLWSTQNLTDWIQVTQVTSGAVVGPVQVQVPAAANGSTFKLSYTP